MTKKITIFDCNSNETYDRDMTEEEELQAEKDTQMLRTPDAMA